MIAHKSNKKIVNNEIVSIHNFLFSLKIFCILLKNIICFLLLTFRTYNVYAIENEANKTSFGLNTPFIMDTSGLWLRRNGLQSNLVCGLIPPLKPTDIPDRDIFHASVHNRYPGFVDYSLRSEFHKKFMEKYVK